MEVHLFGEFCCFLVISTFVWLLLSPLMTTNFSSREGFSLVGRVWFCYHPQEGLPPQGYLIMIRPLDCPPPPTPDHSLCPMTSHSVPSRQHTHWSWIHPILERSNRSSQLSVLHARLNHLWVQICFLQPDGWSYKLCYLSDGALVIEQSSFPTWRWCRKSIWKIITTLFSPQS